MEQIVIGQSELVRHGTSIMVAEMPEPDLFVEKGLFTKFKTVSALEYCGRVFHMTDERNVWMDMEDGSFVEIEFL